MDGILEVNADQSVKIFPIPSRRPCWSAAAAMKTIFVYSLRVTVVSSTMIKFMRYTVTLVRL